jgi:hypothetical protein
MGETTLTNADAVPVRRGSGVLNSDRCPAGPVEEYAALLADQGAHDATPTSPKDLPTPYQRSRT